MPKHARTFYVAEVTRTLEEIVKMFGGRRLRLSSQEERVLRVVAESPVSELRTLVEVVGASKATASRILGKLATKEFVTRRLRPEDARQWVFEATPEGRRALETPVLFPEEGVRAALAEAGWDNCARVRNRLRRVLVSRRDGTRVERELQQPTG